MRIMAQEAYGMIGIVETQTADESNLLAREGSEELLNGEDVLGDLGSRVEGRASDLIGFYRFPLVKREAHCRFVVTLELARQMEIERTIKLGVHGFTDVDLGSLSGYKADEARPLLSGASAGACSLCMGSCSPSG